MQYRNWGHLSEEGKKELGHIFPNSIVPLVSFISAVATLEGKSGTYRVFLIRYADLTANQKQLCLKYLAEKHKVPVEVIRKDIESDGYIPLQEKYISGTGTSNISQLL